MSRHMRSGSVTNNQRAQLANAYQELGKELSSEKLRVVGGYTLGRVIGEGTYGLVHLCIHRLTSTRCAIKKIPKALTSSLTREIHHHRRLHHPNICQLLEVLATESHIYLVTELCAGGELFDYLVERGRLPEQEARRIFGELGLAVGYMHSMGVVHRDLKLENVLLDGELRVKLGDLGFVREWEPGRLLETFCGTTGYASPEMLTGKKYVGEEVDVWSMGIILYCLLCGGLPFDDDDEEVMKRMIIKGEYEEPEWLSEEPLSLIRSMLSLDPAKRPSVKEILAHPWFTKAIYPPPTPHSNVPSPARDHSPLPPSPLAVFESQRSTFFVASDPEPIPASPQAEGASGSEVSETSFEFHDGDRSPGSGVATPTTVESGDAGGDDAKEGSERLGVASEEAGGLAKDGTSTRSSSTMSFQGGLRRTGSESTIRKSGSESSYDGGRFKAPSKIDLTGDVMEEEDEAALEEGEGPSILQLLPLASNSRTPSRTKRRSISSGLSERLVLNASSTHLPHLLATIGATPFPIVDYVSLLTQHHRSQFSTPLEQEILKGLESLGIDTGQLVHSVTNDACDTSGALWWILRAKRAAAQRDLGDEAEDKGARETARTEEREREADGSRGGSVSPTSVTKSSESDRSSLRHEVPQTLPQNLFSRAEPPSNIITVTDDPFGPGRSPAPTNSINIEPPTPTVATLDSPPDLGPPLTSPNLNLNPFGFSTSRSFPNLQDPSTSRSTSPDDRNTSTTPSPGSTPGKSRRSESGKGRSSSVSMLQSLAGLGSLGRKKSDEKLGRDSSDDFKPRSPSPNKLHKAHLSSRSTSSSSRPPLNVNPSASSSSSASTYEPTLSTASPRRSTHPTDRVSESDTLPTIHSVESVSTVASKSHKPPRNNSILTTFRMWFKEDSKKRGGKRPSHLPTSPNHSASDSQFPTMKSSAGGGAGGSNRPSSRRNSVDSRRNSAQVPSTSRRLPSSNLDRPAMGRRSSSQQSIHSRRSSVASLHPLDLSLAGSHDLYRRPSDPGRRSMESRTPSESGKQVRSHSRPSSVRSFNLSYPPGIERNLSRSPTASSAGSTRRSTQASPLQHYHRRVGSGSSTKVVRQIKTVHSSQIRSPSLGSSIRSNSNSLTDIPALGRTLEGLGLSSGGDISDAGPLASLDEEAVEFDTHSSTPRESDAPSLSGSRRGGSGASSYSSTVLVAHRTKSALSSTSPHGSHFPHHHHHHHHHPHTPSRALSRSSWTTSDLTPKAKPVLRDVFASKPLDGDDGDWEDEDDGFEGGLGQGGSKKQHNQLDAFGGSTNANTNAYASSSSTSGFKGRGVNAFAPSSWAAAGTSTSPQLGGGGFPDLPVVPQSAEGLMAAGEKPGKASVGGASRRQVLPPTAFRSAGIIEEDEDEEEE